MISVTHNTKDAIASAKSVNKKFALGSRKAANRAGREIRDRIRDQIPAKRGQPAGKFEGYAASGRLRRNVVASEPVQRPRAGDWTVTVAVRPDGVTDRYARIHRDGGIIRAKRAKYLRFKIKGQWVQVKQVRIRRKNYMADGFRAAQQNLPRIIRDEIAREVR